MVPAGLTITSIMAEASVTVSEFAPFLALVAGIASGVFAVLFLIAQIRGAVDGRSVASDPAYYSARSSSEYEQMSSGALPPRSEWLDPDASPDSPYYGYTKEDDRRDRAAAGWGFTDPYSEQGQSHAEHARAVQAKRRSAEADYRRGGRGAHDVARDRSANEWAAAAGQMYRRELDQMEEIDFDLGDGPDRESHRSYGGYRL